MSRGATPPRGAPDAEAPPCLDELRNIVARPEATEAQELLTVERVAPALPRFEGPYVGPVALDIGLDDVPLGGERDVRARAGRPSVRDGSTLREAETP